MMQPQGIVHGIQGPSLAVVAVIPSVMALAGQPIQLKPAPDGHVKAGVLQSGGCNSRVTSGKSQKHLATFRAQFRFSAREARRGKSDSCRSTTSDALLCGPPPDSAAPVQQPTDQVSKMLVPYRCTRM
jgi:hypothetical protein